jgi:hypothetical protein
VRLRASIFALSRDMLSAFPGTLNMPSLCASDWKDYASNQKHVCERVGLRRVHISTKSSGGCLLGCCILVGEGSNLDSLVGKDGRGRHLPADRTAQCGRRTSP